jgi:sterol desaturase/sphingolipid hydroxylase (fatty acid hydroxylase superfamily)
MSGNFVSKKDESVRLFQNDFLEFWTRVHWSVPLVIYLPVIGFLLHGAARVEGLGPTSMAWLFAAGALAWTLAEYLIHRHVFHFEPRGRLLKQLFWLFHGIHHDYPNDSRRLVMPPAVSVPLAVLFYMGFLALLGKPRVDPFFAGFLTGYLAYDMIHYAIHHIAWRRSRIGLFLKQHHFRHHFQDGDRGFGVSSPLWDYVFGTRHLPAAPEREQSDG